jgi:hypothetical protein
MLTFRKYGILEKHDIGVVFDLLQGESKYVGTAMLCRSEKHTSISMNITDFKFASQCVQFIYCQNRENKVRVVPIEQAKVLFKNGRQLPDSDFKIIEWIELENPGVKFELPF